MINALRQSLKGFEDLRQFDGRPYPEGIEPFPRTLIGQGFFPGGDGLWRDEDPASLRRLSPYLFPRGGIMFLGNDFGFLPSFQKMKLHENPWTWRNLRHRLKCAEVPGQLGFYTNAYLGLRTDRDALAKPIQDPQYDKLCAAFLDFQISTQVPRLIVVLGDRPASLLQTVVPFRPTSLGTLSSATHGERAFGVMVVSHPYSDLSKSPAGKQAEGDTIRHACADLAIV